MSESLQTSAPVDEMPIQSDERMIGAFAMPPRFVRAAIRERWSKAWRTGSLA